jgi:small GTP-binding protein
MNYPFRIMLIGDCGVGKSSLILKETEGVIIGDIIKENELAVEKYGFSCASDFPICLPEFKRKGKMQIWDTNGEERFGFSFLQRSKFGFGKFDCIMIVYDVTDVTSFHNVVNWIKEARSRENDCVILLVGNKCDLQKERVVSFNDGKSLADKLGIPFCEVSAKNGSGVNEMFSCSTSGANKDDKKRNACIKNDNCIIL